MDVRILVLYDSSGNQLEIMADAVGQGIRRIDGAESIVKDISSATPEDLLDADGIVMGSPNWNGVTGRFKAWLDDVSDLANEGMMEGKVGGAFTAGWGRSAGVEATLLQLLHLELTWGMVIVGLPWTERMRTSGSYYGATVHGFLNGDDEEQARAIGARTAQMAKYLRAGGMAPPI